MNPVNKLVCGFPNQEVDAFLLSKALTDIMTEIQFIKKAKTNVELTQINTELRNQLETINLENKKLKEKLSKFGIEEE